MKFIIKVKAEVEAENFNRYGTRKPVKFDIVAHSMGGLLLRYFLRHGDQELIGAHPPVLNWNGAQYVDRAVLVGTPNSGSAEALVNLVYGRRFAPTLPFYPPELMATFPSMFELLPRSRFSPAVLKPNDQPIDILNPLNWARFRWTYHGTDSQARLAKFGNNKISAKDAQRTLAENLHRARLFHRALDKPAAPPSSLEIFLVAGDATDTLKSVSVDPKSGKIEIDARGPGDGTVLRSSVLADDRQAGVVSMQIQSPVFATRTLFLPEEHLGLTSSETFQNNLLFWLLRERRLKTNTAQPTEGFNPQPVSPKSALTKQKKKALSAADVKLNKTPVKSLRTSSGSRSFGSGTKRSPF
jgi:pimeloyl-ACP methyl ester carboxylesterase